MKRIEKTFAELKRKGEKALVAYITAGYPDLETTRALISRPGEGRRGHRGGGRPLLGPHGRRARHPGGIPGGAGKRHDTPAGARSHR